MYPRNLLLLLLSSVENSSMSAEHICQKYTFIYKRTYFLVVTPHQLRLSLVLKRSLQAYKSCAVVSHTDGK
jgi:hypothetical protein